MHFINTVVPFLAMAVQYSAAECDLENKIEEHEDINTSEKACTPRDDGIWTFTMGLSSVGIPTFDGDNAYEGNHDSRWFVLYDSDCTPKGSFDLNQDTDCGGPYNIHMGELPYALVLTEVRSFLGAGDFTFEYADGAFMIGENGCECRDDSSGLRGAEICRCEFPTEGNADDWDGPD